MSAFIDRTWPWLPLGLVGFAVLVGLASLAFSGGQPPAARISTTVQELGVAAANSDGEELCSKLSPGYREEVAARIENLDCAAYVRSFGIGTPGRELRDTPKEPPVIRENTASVELPGIGIRADLVRDGDDWFVDALSPIPARAVEE